MAQLLLSRGCRVTVNDRRPRREVESAVEALEARGASVVLGDHPLSLLDQPLDYIVKNPGIPYSLPLLVEAGRRGIPVYTEIEVATWELASPIVAITGSNGKTTTTTLVGEILAEAGKEPVVAGNIGRVLSGLVDQIRPEQPVVLEVSSFQLLGTETFHPRIAALLNLYPAHLDYHETYEAYAQAKWRMFRNMTANDTAVLNYDQEELRAHAPTLSASVIYFSRRGPVPEGVFVANGEMVVRRDGRDTRLMPVSALGLKGEHNLENALAATALAIWSGADIEAVKSVLMRFRGIEHRLEFVLERQGVSWYNDSKATNPTAAIRALRSFSDHVIWIAGGLDRGDDFHVLTEVLQGRVKAAVLLGQSAERIAIMCREAGVPEVRLVCSVEDAVRAARNMAAPGDVVLFSPSCASWDMFSSFEERGRIFKQAVHTL
ncbi:UDP-N-acetylmuramoylalanine--D-glutamate ligase [Alicyclobacillus contaminans]|nr:UDP-N-acetylmuramoylalanine--D-glutamate ligase [Alicyclobacillus contaminans]